MVMCNSPLGFWKTCVACMDGQQSHGGTICCDTAEDLDFQEEDILKQCEYAPRQDQRICCIDSIPARNDVWSITKRRQ